MAEGVDWGASRPTVALETNLARRGFVRLGKSPAAIEGEDLFGRVSATVPLRLVDLDVLSWLGARRPFGEKEILFSRSRLARDLFDRTPGGRERAIVNQSLQRLSTVSLTFDGYFARAGGQIEFSDARLISELDRPDDRTSRAQLAPWLAEQLERNYVTFLDWATLRALRGLSKRLWIYLEAEDHQRVRRGVPWLALGEKTWTTLGLDFAKPAQARAAVRQAAVRIEELDPRYRLAVKSRGPAYRLEFQLVEQEEDGEGFSAVELPTISKALSPIDQEAAMSASSSAGDADLDAADEDEGEDGDASRVVEVSVMTLPRVPAEPDELLAIWDRDGESLYHRAGCPEVLELKPDAAARIQLAPKPVDLAAWLIQSRLRAPQRCHFCRPPDLPFWLLRRASTLSAATK